ncbi:MAG: 16S rRNA (uracil(1498)-N(3))-methyltransferase [Candidatus Kapabacteria bacterium]|nr:16S rRNA (uracil(1498)-N(3))-methyltransferase [Candidatus Kapabacteria bacterium]
MDHIYIEACQATNETAPLDSDALRHIAALRLRDGEHVRVLNGKGLVATCTIERVGSQVTLRLGEREERAKPIALTLVMPILDSRDRFEFALEKATELGITRFVPLLAERAQHHRTSNARLVAKAIASITQCGVAWLLEIADPVTIDTLPWATYTIVGDEKGSVPQTLSPRPSALSPRPSALSPSSDVCVVVGPEGDFSEREKQILHADPRTLRWAVGSNRLRAETAAIALIANVKVALSDNHNSG